MRLHLHGGMLGAAEFGIGAEIEIADALAAGYRIHQDPDDGFIHGTPMMRCKWSAWVGSPVVPRTESARTEAFREAAVVVRSYWDANGELIDTNNGARLAFDAVAAQIAEGDN